MSGKGGIMLMREPLSSWAKGHVVRLPRWAMPEDAEGYWHVPRSAEFHDRDFGRVRFWCGQSRLMLLSRMTNQTPPTMRCGTCDGRAAGYEAKGDGAIYRPRSAFDLPKLCPWLLLRDRDDHCPYCGSKRSWRRSYCYYDEVNHRPGERLASVAPCPRHGWKRMRRVGDVLACRSWGFAADCDYIASLPEASA